MAEMTGIGDTTTDVGKIREAQEVGLGDVQQACEAGYTHSKSPDILGNAVDSFSPLWVACFAVELWFR